MCMTTLGLDLGANSIGWCLLNKSGIDRAGVRVFPEGVDRFDTKRECSKTESRRVARGMRRQIARRSRRRNRLRSLLIEVGLYPTDAEQQAALLARNPYELRARALDHALEPHEFGRALLHLVQRRGFKSNRKSSGDRKEASELLAEMSELEALRESSGCRTLGEYFARQTHATDHAEHHRTDLHRVRTWHTRRSMYESEFEQMWASQAGRKSKTAELLANSDKLKDRIHEVIFYQRDLYWPKWLIGRCELEPRQARCPKADRLAQRFRLLQEVNNLQYLDETTGAVERLNADQRKTLLTALERKKEMTFDEVRKLLGFIDSMKFNLERGERSKIKGAITDVQLAGTKVFGKRYWKLDDATRDTIVRALLDEEDDERLAKRAMSEWDLDEEEAKRLAGLELPTGYLHLSRMALEKLVPHMERGLLYMTADDTPSALSEAGYLRPDQLRKRVQADLPQPPDLPNPVVRQTLYEVRKLVNALLNEKRRETGDPNWKPDRIHVELARNAKASAEERQKMSKRRAKREAERDAAADEIRAYADKHDSGIKVNRSRIDAMLLWKEQGGKCLYCGEPLSIRQIMSGEANVDHILPYSRTLDGSFENRTASHVKCNSRKGNQTPFEWLGSNAKQFDELCQRVRILPWEKRKRFLQKTLDLDGFIKRQLNDTRYISRAVVEYVRCLMDQPHFVLCPKGSHTATLRHMWGLDSLLATTGDSPAWESNKGDLPAGEKNRADHRHHAIDAIVLALTDHSRLKSLAGIVAGDESLPPPWSDFRADVQKSLDSIRVSHKARRKVGGALHEETVYGKTATAGEYVYRKKLEDLKPSMVDEIRDPEVKRLVKERLATHKGSGTEESGIPKEVWKEPLLMVRRPGRNGSRAAPIRKVRLLRRDQSITGIRGGTAFVRPGSTHHIAFFIRNDTDGEREFHLEFTTMLEAARRVREHEPIIRRAHGTLADAKFAFSLSQREMVMLHIDGKDRLYRFDTAASTTQQMWFLPHTSAQEHGRISKRPSSLMSLNPRKVTVDPLGRIRWAND